MISSASFASESKNIGGLQTIALHQWIEQSRSKQSVLYPASGHLKCAMTIALKLAGCLAETESLQQYGALNAVPLSSIASENVVLQVRQALQSKEAFQKEKPSSASAEDADMTDENTGTNLLFRPQQPSQNEDAVNNDSMPMETFNRSADSLFSHGLTEEDNLMWDESDEQNFVALLNSIDDPKQADSKQITDGCDDIIESAKIIVPQGSKLDIGDNMSRLSALGAIFYELFSGKKLALSRQQQLPIFNKSASESSLHGMTLKDKMEDSRAYDITDMSSEGNCDKSPRHLEYTVDVYSNSMNRLQLSGIPWSLCTLVGNLLDCRHGTGCGEDAYQSFSEVQMDLKLMLDDPPRFLNDMDINSQPSLSISDKLYGREDEMNKIKEAYQKSRNGECSGVFIIGDAGVGKSTLATYVQNLTTNANGLFLSGKFDQNQDSTPLSVIRTAFDECCGLFAREGSQKQINDFAASLKLALGIHLSALIELLPSLSTIFPSSPRFGAIHDCADSAKRTRYLLCTLAEMLSSFMIRPISLFLDDLQWADPSSLLLVQSLLGEAKNNTHLFFTGCFRDNEDLEPNIFQKWRHSVSVHPVLQVALRNLDAETVNILVSDTLHLLPRVTLPLSSALYHKTRGNPLFLRRILESLKQDGCLYFNVNFRRWMWDINKIINLKLPDDVITLLMKEMQQLSDELQLGLKVASCMGGSFDKILLPLLSNAMEVDLRGVFSKLSEKGFIQDIEAKYRFSHDRIQQAAYHIMPSQQRQIYHARLGLAICDYASNESQNDELFFLSVNQINRGGPQYIVGSRQREMSASLNLKAGKRSVRLSDFHSAFNFFKQGISFLSPGHWEYQYELSLNLFEETAEAACVLNDLAAAEAYSEHVLTHARCFDDKLHTLYVTVAALRHAILPQEAIRRAFEILPQIGEGLPRPFDDCQLQSEIRQMSDKIEDMTDDFIFNMKVMKKKHTTLMKLYRMIFHVLCLIEPAKMAAVSLRMVELTFSEGLCSTAPTGLASFGMMLVLLGNPSCGYRIGTLALRLVAKLKSKGFGCCNESDVIFAVCQFISWTSESFQSVSQTHVYGYIAGKQSGDILPSIINYKGFIFSSFFSGEKLIVVQKNILKLLDEFSHLRQRNIMHIAIVLLYEIVALTGGLGEVNANRFAQLPSKSEINEMSLKTKNTDLHLSLKIFQTIHAFFFRECNAISHETSIFNRISESKCSLRIIHLSGIFYEGLLSYRMARQTNEEKWIAMGEVALSSMKWWSQFSSWNFSNKALLLDAEKMFTQGYFDRASGLYEEAIKSACEHKFVHEEAIACELAGMFYYKRNLDEKSREFLIKARENYRIWGATGIVNRIEEFIEKETDRIDVASIPESNVDLSFYDIDQTVK